VWQPPQLKYVIIYDKLRQSVTSKAKQSMDQSQARINDALCHSVPSLRWGEKQEVVTGPAERRFRGQNPLVMMASVLHEGVPCYRGLHSPNSQLNLSRV